MSRSLHKMIALTLVLSMVMAIPVFAQPVAVSDSAPVDVGADAAPQAVPLSPNAVNITILHTNDFHGNLEQSGSSTPGMARVAYVINDVRSEVGEDNVALFDIGDIMQGTLLSNLFKGESTIDVYNLVGYDLATLGNHEFDWGQTTLISRTEEADFPFVAANVVVQDGASCAASGWTSPAWVKPWITMTVGAAGNQVVLGIIGLGSVETPFITIASATEGLCFKDPAESVLHYYDALDAVSDAIIVLSHNGLEDGGYGYGVTVYGDKTLAQRLIDAGKPVPLILGGHSHTNMFAPVKVGDTTVAQAYYAGRKVGRADLTIDKDAGTTLVSWHPITVTVAMTEDVAVKDRITQWANDPWYLAEKNRIVGYTAVTITRNYNGDSLMGAFVNDAIYNDLNDDSEPANDVDMVFNNAGGLRADIIPQNLSGTVILPYTLTHGMLYSVLPFGNQTIVGDMTGAQIVELLNQSATLFKGALQVAGVRYSFYRYSDALPGPQPWAWGAYDIEVYDREAEEWGALVMTETYRIATNEFLAPAGQDGYSPFKYVTNISYWGDMLNGVERWVSKAYSTTSSAYAGTLDGRITRNGTDTYGGTATEVVPVNVLHHNDSHGNLAKGAYVGYTQLATLIDQERQHNPDRSILLNAGDQIQGDSMMYYFKSAFTGKAADGTTLPVTMTTHPMMAAMNAMTYTAMTVGNHEYNFGHYIFTGTLGQANFPMLQANVYDDGEYGLDEVPILPHVTTTVPGPSGDIKLAVLGIGNHRIPNYELPSNIPGLHFTNPITETQARAPALKAANDAVIALTHIGFTENPASVEVDENVDTNLAAQTTGVDAIIGGHSHTDPSKGFGDYKYLPTVVGAPDNTPVLINHAYRYNNTLGEVVLGLLPKVGGGYEVVARSGRYIKVDSNTPEDARIKAIVDPYVKVLAAYNNTAVAQTTVPIDALTAYTEETNGANLQVDASVWEMAQHGINVDFHLSGAMSNRKVAYTATVTNPHTLTVADMFTLMPYENSLVALKMNGPQLKAVLERAYRNYYYYKYVPNAGGYSYYTTCMLDINAGGQITYNDTYPMLPNGNNVASLVVNGNAIDFMDATKFYTVSTVNYLAAGSCNFNDSGVSLWPLDEESIVADTQYYVRDAVINYATDMGVISPTIEGRLVFVPAKFIYLPIIMKDA